jgi:UDP-2,4-diacetamido-2,4,6-trideoxy-beta-L-altropyranose hydrolase
MMISSDKTLTVVSKASYPAEGSSIWIHTTASPQIGYGHLRRSLTVAQALRNYCTPLFLLNPDDQWSEMHLANRGFRSFDEGFNKAWSVLMDPVAILIDTRLTEGLDGLIRCAKTRGIPVISIHDLGLNPLPSDVIIDGSIAPPHYDSSHSNTACFNGTHYMILDPVYHRLHQQNRQINKEIRSIFINLGGGNSGEFYLRVLEGIKLWAREVEVIGVPGFTSWGQEQFLGKDWRPLRFRWESENIEKILGKADLAITAGGIAAYEALCVGTPLLALSYDHLQQITITMLSSSGACIDLGPGKGLEPARLSEILSIIESDIERRRLLSCQGKQIVDGLGVERVARIIRQRIEKRFETGDRRGQYD